MLKKNYNEKCDVWSCGVILYILLCGYPPFQGKSKDEIFKRILEGKFSFKGRKKIRLYLEILQEEHWKNVSEEAKDLICQTLIYDPEKRISAKKALEHKWFRLNKENALLNREILENLSRFHVFFLCVSIVIRIWKAKNKLAHLIFAFIASNLLSNQEKEDMRLTFQALDANNDGFLTKDDITRGLISICGDEKLAKQKAEEIISDMGAIDDKIEYTRTIFRGFFDLEHKTRVYCFVAFKGENTNKAKN